IICLRETYYRLGAGPTCHAPGSQYTNKCASANEEELVMIEKTPSVLSGRRTVLRTALAVGAANMAPPFLRYARGAQPVLIGLANPLTGTYAAVGKNELTGCELAVSQINAKGGILGRQVELRVEDSTSGDAGTAVQKSRKLIERDKVDFLLG